MTEGHVGGHSHGGGAAGSASGSAGPPHVALAVPHRRSGEHGGEHGGKSAYPPLPLESAAHWMAGTALVFAALAMKVTLPQEQYNEQYAKAARLFAGVRDGAGHDFVSLHFLFMGLLFPPAGLPQSRKWVPKSRIWRFILLVQKDGHFELTQGLATALFAQTEHEGDEGDSLRFEAEALRESMPRQLSKRCEEAARERPGSKAAKARARLLASGRGASPSLCARTRRRWAPASAAARAAGDAGAAVGDADGNRSHGDA